MKKIIAFALVALWLVISITPVFADAAPPEPPAGSDPEPGRGLTNVRMMSETVFVEISADGKGNSKVTATFTMRNIGDTDEQMEVRFPIRQTVKWGHCELIALEYPPIADFKAKVDGLFVSTKKTYKTVILSEEKKPYPTIAIPCWENFTASFPAGKDVIIEVSYMTEPYHFPDGSYIYSYVLKTGRGWKGTIGSADIIFQLPYELNDSNFYGCWGEPCIANGDKIQWHYEDFDPTSNVRVSLLPPPLWQKMDLEKKNTTTNPNDGEAWGRLAKAYKESIMQRRGFQYGDEAMERYRLSKEAYEKATALLPNDVDWQYGFAELLCGNAGWGNDFLVNSNTEAWIACVEQIKRVLDLSPNHARTKKLIEDFRINRMIDFSGGKPDYLFLTEQPSESPTPTEEPDQATMTPTIKASPTIQETKTETPELTTTNTPMTNTLTTSTPTASPSQVQTEPSMSIFIGGAILLVIAVLLSIKFRKA